MAVVPQGKRLPPILPPFQRRDVEEWSTLDSLTGILEHARVQTDHWAATTCNSSHHFGKVIDSRARNLADGSKEQRKQTKQLEVFQANIPGGSVQVIRSQSLTTSSWQGQSTTTKLGSGSSWSARANSKSVNKNEDTEFDNLKLALNPLDISSQKMKASVVRRGSIGSRRPPTRPRSIAGSRSDKPGQIVEEEEVADGLNHLNSSSSSSNNNNNSSSNISSSNKLSQTSRICQQYHQEAKNNSSFQSSLRSSSTLKQTYLANGSDSSISNDKRPSSGPVTLSFLLDSKKENLDSKNTIKKKSPLVHKKSCSSEDLRLSPETDLLNSEDTETSDDWKRSSKARRSLQFPVQSKSEQDNYSSDIKSVNSVLKVAKEIEARKQIVTNSLKNNQWEDVIKSVVSNQNFEKNNSEINTVEDELIIKDNNKVVKKKPSFITVESLKEVRGRLRRLNSTVTDETKYEDDDDGIVTELKGDSPIDELEETPKSVKSYVYGMESLLRNSTGTNRPTTITGTGSLESRSTSKSSSNGSNRSEEWYNRRKSYGFEQVNGQSSTQGTNLYGDKNKVDSSTDSGICRSSETVANVQFCNKPLTSNPDGNNIKTSHMITIKRIQDNDGNERESPTKQDGFNSDLIQKGRKTVVTLGVASKNSTWNWNNQNDKSQIDEQANIVGSGEAKEVVSRGKIADAIRSLRERTSEMNGFESRRLSEPITISIPVSTLDDSEIVENSGLLLKQTKEPSTIEKLNLSKQFNDDSSQFSTSYSKLLYGTNYADNEQNIKSNIANAENKNNVNLQISSWNRHTSTKDNEFKRHSIAVDEAKYMEGSSKETFEMPSVKDKIASFKNQFDLKSNSSEKVILPIGSSNSLPNDKNKIHSADNDIDYNTNEKKQKKVEFCKTEVHFAAEPGRFNIVETDGKPPSSNMFRRRRRTIAETPILRSNLPEIRFGDSQYEKDLLTCCDVNDPDGEKSLPPKASSPVYRLSPQFIDNNSEEDGCIITQGNTLTPIENDSHEETDVSFKINELNQQDIEEKPRSILKHNVHKQQQCNHIEDIKPSYEITDNSIANQSNISLKLVTTDSKSIPWKSTVRLQQNTFSSDDSESELQKLLKTLRPVPIKQSTVVSSYNSSNTASGLDSSATAADNGLAVRISSAVNLPDQRRASWSVSEQVRHVEDSKNRGFSTKVNFGSGETTIVTPELRTSPVRDVMSSGWISDPVNNNDEVTTNSRQEAVHVKINQLPPSNLQSSNRNRRLTHSKSFTSSSSSSLSSASSNQYKTNAVEYNFLKDCQLRKAENELQSTSLVMKMLSRSPVSNHGDPNDNITLNFVSSRRNGIKNDSSNSVFQQISNVNEVTSGDSVINRIHQFEKIKNGSSQANNIIESRNLKNSDSKNKEVMLNSLNRMITSNRISQSRISKHTVNPLFVDENRNLMINNEEIMNSSDGLIKSAIPEVLDVLDDLSRCIEEVIVEIPRPNKSSIKPTANSFKESNSNVFKLVEDFKSIGLSDGTKKCSNSLAILNEFNDGDLSDDSLKADEEVRSYMSAGNEGDNSDNEGCDNSITQINRKKSFKHINKMTNFDNDLKKEITSAKKVQHVVSSNIVPTYVGSSNKVKSVETLVSTRSGHPKITSISLRYTDDGNNESGKSIDNLQSLSRNEIGKCNIFKAHSETTQNMNVFKSESNANKITGYSPADNVLINSKMSKSPSRLDISETDVKFKSTLNQLNSSQNEAIYEEIKMNDDVVPQKLPSQVLITNRKTHSPSSDSVFVERTSKQQSLFNQVNSRNRSMSPVPFPTRPVVNLPDYANTRQINMMQKQTVPTRITAGDSTVWSSVSVSKTKKKEVTKKDDNKKKSSDDNLIQRDAANKLHRKERRPSTNSSGRDGWLNTPKENNAKQRVNYSQTKRQTTIDARKDKKIMSTSNNSTYKIENSGKTSVRHGSESPIYQNREVYSKTLKEKDPFESLETESAILEELTRAADQILLAVNGYTDEESVRASSDDEFKRKHGKEKPPSKPLSTISEMPVKRKTVSTALRKENFSKASGSPVQSSVGASSRSKLCKTSSNSSIEGTAEAKSLLTEERSKRRAARLLQRASSRELLLQNTGASSSEDVASGTETTPQRNKQRVVRRTAKQYSSRTSHQNSTVASTSRTKDRVQRTEGCTIDEKERVIHSRRRTDEKSKTNRISTTPGSGRTSMPPTGAIRCERSSRLVERRPPEKPGGGGGRAGGYGGGGGVGRTRNQHALSKKKCTSGASHREIISQPIK